MSEHRYAHSAVRGDYARAAIGLSMCGGVLLGIGVAGLVMYVFLGLTALFAYFAWRTWARQMMVVTLDSDGMTTSGIGRTRLDWRDLQMLKLSYYATRRSRGDGWMQLTVKGENARISIDSHIEDFATIARRTHHAAAANGVAMSGATTANLAALGVGEAAKTRWGDLRQSLSEPTASDNPTVATARRQP